MQYIARPYTTGIVILGHAVPMPVTKVPATHVCSVPIAALCSGVSDIWIGSDVMGSQGPVLPCPMGSSAPEGQHGLCGGAVLVCQRLCGPGPC